MTNNHATYICLVGWWAYDWKGVRCLSAPIVGFTSYTSVNLLTHAKLNEPR